MIEIFRDISTVKVGHYKSILEAEGIATFVRNENLALTEVPIPIFYPALCVVHESDHQRALQLLSDQMKLEETQAKAEDINCPACNEENPASFDVCWSCQASLK